MKEVTIQIPEGKKAELINGVLRFVDDKPKDVTDRVKTFEDAVKELGGKHPLVKEWKSICDTSTDLEAYLKLRIIIAALNEGWEPQFTHGELRYYPYFHIEEQGTYLSLSSQYIPSSKFVSVGSRLYLKNEKLADYCGKQFIHIWQDYLLLRKN